MKSKIAYRSLHCVKYGSLYARIEEDNNTGSVNRMNRAPDLWTTKSGDGPFFYNAIWCLINIYIVSAERKPNDSHNHWNPFQK